ncbi:MAG TPA: hypothetical protein VFM06_05720 [Candidatus Limnocylindria bacterium]|nr:hypothetical protein [Candidatus Limnocylindria bacterium]
MTGELPQTIVDLVQQAGALLDGALRTLYAAGASGGMDAGPLAAGGAAGAAAGAGAASGGDRDDRDRSDRGDRGFRYASGDGSIYDGTGSGAERVGSAPNGSRLMYDQIARDAGGNPTHYHVNSPGGATGWIPAGNTSGTRPTAPPPPRPSRIVESGPGVAGVRSAQTTGARG